MIPYNLPQEKITALHYADLLNDKLKKAIIEKGSLQSEEEHLANFFWLMVDAFSEEDKENGQSSEDILEKIIITFMAFFRSSDYELVWKKPLMNVKKYNKNVKMISLRYTTLGDLHCRYSSKPKRLYL